MSLRFFKGTDQDLIADIRESQEKAEVALNYMYTNYQKVVTQKVKAYNLSVLSADDLLSEAITELWMRIKDERFILKGSLKAYFTGIVNNKCYDRKRLQRRENIVGIDHLPVDQKTPDFFAELSSQTNQAKTLEIMDNFPHTNCKELFRLKADGLSYAEIAQIKGYGATKASGVNTIKTMIRRCRKRLGKWLAEHPEMDMHLRARHPLRYRRYIRE